MRALRCTMCQRVIEGETKYFTNERHINFIRSADKTFRPIYGVCSRCYKRTIEIYEAKKASAIRKLKERLRSTTVQVSNPSITSSSSLSTTNDSKRTDSFDKMVFKTPRNPLLRSVTSDTRQNESSTTSTTSGGTAIIATQSPVDGRSSSSRLSPLNTEPSTSAAAAARKRTKDAQTHNRWQLVDSPAVVNRSRLPDVQPIPKRRTFVHANKDIMDIYLSDLKGG